MVPPLLWVISPAADTVNGWRFDANLSDASLPATQAPAPPASECPRNRIEGGGRNSQRVSSPGTAVL